MRLVIGLLAALSAGQAVAQGLPGLGGGGLPGGIPGLTQPETPEQKRAFCQRVGAAALRCGLTLDVTALSACLVRTLPPQDSLRVARVADRARGSAASLLSECGIGFGR
jgi:hypothetical protein